jgi:hypothetical protein
MVTCSTIVVVDDEDEMDEEVEEGGGSSCFGNGLEFVRNVLKGFRVVLAFSVSKKGPNANGHGSWSFETLESLVMVIHY